MNRKKESQWIPAFYDLSSMFEDCRRLTKNLQWPMWPDCNELNHLWPMDNYTRSGFKTHFIEQGSIDFDGKYYEEYIYDHGDIPTRNSNWHDFFNAMVWLQFPKTKSLINSLHVEEMSLQQEGKQRTRKRDALTLFDESGVIFVTSEDKNSHDLQEHQWKKLFYKNRNEWSRTITVFIFGHGLYEKALNPYIGMTGNALVHKVPENFFQLSRQAQLAELDESLTEKMLTRDLLQQPSYLCPLPLLGVPGWWSENNEEVFYENEQYFRPAKTSSAVKG